MEIKTRRQAAEAGENKYYTGKPCVHGHDGPRYTASGICCKCNNDGVKRYNKNLTKMKVSRALGAFTYPLHPDDHAAALAYCQALDLQRGRVPQVPEARPVPAPFDAVEARRQIFGRCVDLVPPAPDYLPKP